MGTVAALSAIRPDPAPTLGAARRLFRDRIRASLVEPHRSVSRKFDLSLNGVWRDLLQAFAGHPYKSLVERNLTAGDEGVWAVRGRRLAYPLPSQPGPPEAIHGNDLTILFNDGGDVRQITEWLAAGPTERFISHFRSQHEAYVDNMLEEGASPREIQQYAGGGREDAPYLGHWERLHEFYRKASAEQLWVECYIG